jgi:hypothetical protein
VVQTSFCRSSFPHLSISQPHLQVNPPHRNCARDWGTLTAGIFSPHLGQFGRLKLIPNLPRRRTVPTSTTANAIPTNRIAPPKTQTIISVLSIAESLYLLAAMYAGHLRTANLKCRRVLVGNSRMFTRNLQCCRASSILLCSVTYRNACSGNTLCYPAFRLPERCSPRPLRR